MAYEGPKTRNGIRNGLETRYDRDTRSTSITLYGDPVGRLVSYGKKNVLSSSKTGFRPTVYSGRVKVDGMSLDVEASSASAVLNALATKLNQAFRSGVRSTPSGYTEHESHAAHQPTGSPPVPKN
jgi:hypothetical protein